MKDSNSKESIEYKYVNDNSMIEDIRVLFAEYVKSLEIDLSFQNFQSELQTLPGKYSPPEGALILATVNAVPAGCIALRKISEGICEMKRLYVRPDYRKLGIGKELVRLIILEGKKLGYHHMRLDTLSTMGKAQALYREFGFYDIEAYVFNPIEGTKYMELCLEKHESF